MEPYHLRRSDKAIDDPESLAEVLLSTRWISLAMCSGNEPYLVVLNHGFDRERGCLYFHCAPKGRKIEVLKENPRVWGMAVDDRGYLHGKCDHAYRSVMFGGNVTILERGGDKLHALEIMIRQQERDPDPVIAEQLTEKRVAATTIGRIDIEVMTGKQALDEG